MLTQEDIAEIAQQERECIRIAQSHAKGITVRMLEVEVSKLLTMTRENLYKKQFEVRQVA